jgi:Xaa-Pro aminopeptidase
VVAGAPGFLRFATLTLVPIDLSMADAAQLNRSDIAYLDAYHAQVRAALTGRLSQRAEAYLVEATAPLHEQLGALAA